MEKGRETRMKREKRKNREWEREIGQRDQSRLKKVGERSTKGREKEKEEGEKGEKKEG